MTHPDPETLALPALGEHAASAVEQRHLSGCDRCRAEVRRFTRAVSATRDTDPQLLQPAPRVWAGIVDALGLDVRGLDAAGLDAAAAPVVAPQRPVAPVRRLRRGLVGVLAAAAAVLAIGGVAVGLLQTRSAVERIATASLQPFPAWPGASGTAVLERLPDGHEVVQVTTTVQPDGRTDHEVWLMTAGAKRLVSLGMLRGTSGTFAVPAGIDVSRFRLVDVSDELRDGNPAHSGDSIVRGVLKS